MAAEVAAGATVREETDYGFLRNHALWALSCHSGLAGRKFSDQKNYEYYLTTALDYYDNYSSDDGTAVICFYNSDLGLTSRHQTQPMENEPLNIKAGNNLRTFTL